MSELLSDEAFRNATRLFNVEEMIDVAVAERAARIAAEAKLAAAEKENDRLAIALGLIAEGLSNVRAAYRLKQAKVIARAALSEPKP